MFKPFILIAVMLVASPAIAARRIHVRIVVVTMFERGADIGDEPGEFQYWVEREKLDRVYPFPCARVSLISSFSIIYSLVQLKKS